jgi:hypothetical protein
MKKHLSLFLTTKESYGPQWKWLGSFGSMDVLISFMWWESNSSETHRCWPVSGHHSKNMPLHMWTHVIAKKFYSILCLGLYWQETRAMDDPSGLTCIVSSRKNHMDAIRNSYEGTWWLCVRRLFLKKRIIDSVPKRIRCISGKDPISLLNYTNI